MEKDADYVIAIKWLWKNRNKPFKFFPSVLTEENRSLDSTTIDPPLTIIEAENLFQFLSRKELLFQQQSGPYIINKVEAYKWKVLISDLKRWNWTRFWLWGALRKAVVLLTITITGGVFGAIATKWTETKLSTVKQEMLDDSKADSKKHAKNSDSPQRNDPTNQGVLDVPPPVPIQQTPKTMP